MLWSSFWGCKTQIESCTYRGLLWNEEALSEVIARLESVDGLTFNQIANSSLIRRAFKADGYFLPTSPQNIRDHFIKEFEKTLRIVSEKVGTIPKNWCRFSIIFDEAASVKNRRYTNRSFSLLVWFVLKVAWRLKNQSSLFEKDFQSLILTWTRSLWARSPMGLVLWWNSVEIQDLCTLFA